MQAESSRIDLRLDTLYLLFEDPMDNLRVIDPSPAILLNIDVFCFLQWPSGDADRQLKSSRVEEIFFLSKSCRISSSQALDAQRQPLARDSQLPAA